MAFWGQDLNVGTRDPKRKFRWRISIEGVGQQSALIWYAKSVDKPKMEISADTVHKFLGHSFKFPGSVTWQDINVVLVDPVEPDAGKQLLNMVHNSGYRFPEDKTTEYLETISKGKASKGGLKTVRISQLAADGTTTIEEWLLRNPFIKSVEFDQLNYEEDGLSEITLGLAYDWAYYNDGPIDATQEMVFGKDYNPDPAR